MISISTPHPDTPAGPTPPKKSLGRRLLWFFLAVVLPCCLAVFIFKAVMHYWAHQAIASAEAAAEQDQAGWRQVHLAQPPAADARGEALREELTRLAKSLPEGWPWNAATEEAGTPGAVSSFVLRKGSSVVDKLYYHPPLLPYDESQLAGPRAEYVALEAVYRQLPTVPPDVTLSFPPDPKRFRAGRMHATTAALYQLAQLRLLRTFLRIEEGTSKGIGEDLGQLTRIIGLMSHDPTVRGCLARQAVTHGTLLMAERWLARHAPGEADLAPLQSALEWKGLGAPELTRVLRFERAARFEQLEQNLDVPHAQGQADESSWAAWLSPADDVQKARNKFLPLMNEAVKFAASPRNQWPGQWGPWGKELQKLAANLHPEFQAVYGWLTNVQSACLQETMLQARCEATRAALAAERFRLKKGQWPAQASEIVPAYLDRFPPDPYLDSPLRMRRLGDSLTVYSVGLDQVDHLGHLNRQLGDVEQTDLGVQLWLPSARKLVTPPPAAQ